MPADGANEREYSWEVAGADAEALRGAMSHFPTGVTVVTSGQEENVEGMTANAVVSVSLDPLLFLVSVHKDALRLARALQRPSGAPLSRRRLRLDRGTSGGGRPGGDRMRTAGHVLRRRP